MYRACRVSVLGLLSALMFVVWPVRPVAADGFIVVENHPSVEAGVYGSDPGWHAIQRRHPHHRRRPWTPLHVQSHHVSVNITDQVAVTTVDQVFFNHSGHRLEGTYIFPIPKGAQIDRFTMDINGVETEAELLEANKARQIYTSIVRSMRDPALLEYIGQGMFRMRIFPIEPHSPKRIKLQYTQVLEQDGSLIDYTYPLNTEKFSSRPIDSLSMKVSIESTVPIHTAYSPTHTVELTRPDARHAVIGFETSNALPHEDFTVLYARQQDPDDPIGVTVLTHRPSEGADGYFMLIASPQAAIDEDHVAPKDIVFVVDTSGSMAGAKLRQAREALQFCLANLNEGDRFDIVRFATEAESLFGSLRAVDEESSNAANAFIEAFKPIGGTAIDDALRAAADIAMARDDAARPAMVIFLTDGRPTIGQTNDQRILQALSAKLDGATCRYFCFGIGHEINTKLLDRIAEDTRAMTEYVHPDEDLEVKVSRFYERIDAPILTNPTLTASRDVGIDQLHPRHLPDIFKGDQMIVLGRYSSDGDAVLSLNGNVQGAPVQIDVEAPFAKEEVGNAFLPRLWATRRVGYLLDHIRMNGESEELRDEVVRLARQFSIVTPYTAYLIVEDEERRALPGRMRSFGGGSINGVAPAEIIDESRVYYLGLQTMDSGGDAVRAAEDMKRMRGAGGGGGFGGGAPGAAAGQATGVREALHDLDFEYAGERRVAGPMSDHRGGRAFYRHGERWVDATVQTLPEDAEVVEVEFGSAAYFELLDRGPRVAEWLSVGEAIDLVLDGKVYRVVVETAEDAESSD